jgi:hypothetical protein
MALNVRPPSPRSVSDWERRKGAVQATLWRLLGDLPPRDTPTPRITSSERDGYRFEKLAFDNGAGATVYGYLLVPPGRVEPGPAILYLHHYGGGFRRGKEELFHPEPLPLPPGPALVAAGCTVLAIDAYAHGQRQQQGPAGERESGAETELALFKQFLWQGRTLWGMMVRDDALALDYLLTRPEVDPRRVGVVGANMGATRARWLAALDDRLAVTVTIACLTHYQSLIRRGALNGHNIYYYLPNVLREGIDMEAVVGLIAPRPLLTLTGDQDEISLVEGVHLINGFVREVYDLYGAADLFKGVVYEGIGHAYTPQMWEDMLAWFDTHLAGQQQRNDGVR